jgi:hypothetical protein
VGSHGTLQKLKKTLLLNLPWHTYVQLMYLDAFEFLQMINLRIFTFTTTFKDQNKTKIHHNIGLKKSYIFIAENS